MRSSNKSRSRNKSSNRNRSVGNVVNRVFDSAGPEGKVRGTPQQIIEKYQTLARDAQLSGDRVAAENFQQHAEHYTRLLGEAQREQAEQRQAQEAQNGQQRGDDGNRQPQGNGQDRGDGNGNGNGNTGSNDRPQGDDRAQGDDAPKAEQETAEQPVVANGNGNANGSKKTASKKFEETSDGDDSLTTIDLGSDDDAPIEIPLVATPEDTPKPRATRTRRPRASRSQAAASDEGAKAE